MTPLLTAITSKTKRTSEIEKTRRMLPIFTCLVLVAVALYAADGTTASTETREKQQTEMMERFIPQLHSRAGAKSNDSELQLGIAILSRRYDASRDLSERGKTQLERVLELDPNNRIAWEIRANDAVARAIRMRRDLVDLLEYGISNAKARGEKELYVWNGPPLNFSRQDPSYAHMWHNPLYDALRGETRGTVVVQEKDYDQARTKVRQQADNELNQALNAVDEAAGHDVRNALYNYLKAQLYFELRQPALAVKELQAAVRKPFIQRYLEQKERAVTRALDVADAPAALKSYAEPRSSFGDYIQLLIWRPQLEPLADRMEAEGDLDRAKEIYEVSIEIAKQIREEPLPYVSTSNKGTSARMERWATERVSALAKRKAEPAKPSDNTPPKE